MGKAEIHCCSWHPVSRTENKGGKEENLGREKVRRGEKKEKIPAPDSKITSLPSIHGRGRREKKTKERKRG